jgi:cobalt transporter subunit CbtB
MNATTTNARQGAAIQSSAKLIAAFALLVGLGIVFVTGFSGSTTLHNAAHDSRHAMAFPCH